MYDKIHLQKPSIMEKSLVNPYCVSPNIGPASNGNPHKTEAILKSLECKVGPLDRPMDRQTNRLTDL